MNGVSTWLRRLDDGECSLDDAAREIARLCRVAAAEDAAATAGMTWDEVVGSRMAGSLPDRDPPFVDVTAAWMTGLITDEQYDAIRAAVGQDRTEEETMDDHVMPSLTAAVARAEEWHATQTRKATPIPYVSHLLAVAALVMEDGGDHDQVVAALLHDAAEDQGGEETLAVIESEFGARVADIVRACSDSLQPIGAEKAPWRERKEAALAQLADSPEEALTVVAADKLHNLRATVVDHAIVGDEVWDRFNTDREGFLWYHHAMHDLLARRIPGSRSVVSLELEMARFEEALR